MPDSMVATHDSTNTASLKLSLDSKTDHPGHQQRRGSRIDIRYLPDIEAVYPQTLIVAPRVCSTATWISTTTSTLVSTCNGDRSIRHRYHPVEHVKPTGSPSDTNTIDLLERNLRAHVHGSLGHASVFVGASMLNHMYEAQATAGTDQ
ncbi:hypothetical protein EVJ58_g9731 [Rhodofomes roseus]|uniref:Uncharacterized protein n=1 Tax=Rhodofomes roseus TaxID=34475 RepID=A0A4Y9XS16_9APHY|nr:hypothetical protein EVJ58_g9731 [Rhodofomes roseus]